MTPTEIKKTLLELGTRPDKKLGQHFLIDNKVLDAVIRAAEIQKGDRVLEVGPGLGVLTRALVEKRADVTAIEMDNVFVKYLHSVIPAEAGIHIKHGDAAHLDWDRLLEKGSLDSDDSARDDDQWKFVSNLPYSITSLALRKALWAKNPPTRVVVLIQKEVAERIVEIPSPTATQLLAKGRGGTQKGSLLSLMVALSSSSVRTVRRVARGAFYPAPKVESAVLEIVPMTWPAREQKWGIHPDEIMKVAKRGFSHPRKMLASNLGISKHELEKIGIAPNARAENLAVESWAALAPLF